MAYLYLLREYKKNITGPSSENEKSKMGTNVQTLAMLMTNHISSIILQIVED